MENMLHNPKAVLSEDVWITGFTDLRRAASDALAKIGAADWLNNGETVLLKVSVNSGNPFPYTTNPKLVNALAVELRRLGAKVIVGDGSGLEYVCRPEKGPRPYDWRRKADSHKLMDRCGIGPQVQEAGAKATAFELADYTQGFYEASRQALDWHWKQALVLTKTLTEVHHIIHVPRLSSHIIAGMTSALKISVGYLREDSRLVLHNDMALFQERCAEINLAPELRSRLRGVITDASIINMTMGPDWGRQHAFRKGLLIASCNPAHHDVAAWAVLQFARRNNTKWYHRIIDYPAMARLLNFILVFGTSLLSGRRAPWFKYRGAKAPSRGKAHENPLIRRGLELFSDGSGHLISGTDVDHALLNEIKTAMTEAMQSVHSPQTKGVVS